MSKTDQQTLSRKVEEWPLVGVYKSDSAWRVVFRRSGWTTERFVVVKLFIGNPTFTVKFWSGSLQKTAAHWNTIPVNDYPDSIVPQALTHLLEVIEWTH
jgi:hypothetical protein